MSNVRETVIAAALADMRAGRRVLVIAANNAAIYILVDAAARELLAGEKAYRANGDARITSPDSGRIYFRSYFSIVQGTSGRGLTLDRIYVDHSDLREQLVPALLLMPDGLANLVHC